MEIFTAIHHAQLAGPTVLTIGNFDGVHRGHVALLQTLGRAAAALPGAHTAIVTFDPHPLHLLRPEQPHFLLTTPQERLVLADQVAIEYGIIQPFDHALAQLDPAQFLTLLKQHLGMAHLVVGPDFVLGRGRTGNLDLLRSLGKTIGYTVEVMEPVDWAGHAVRSSNIRQLLGAGEVDLAAELLGRPYHVNGVVEEGDRRGRLLGSPTANLRTDPNKLLPAHGVYATYAWVDGKHGLEAYPSVSNLGIRPTINGVALRLETHILDFPPEGHSGDLYGQTLTLEFLQRLRGEQRFPSLDALAAQIQQDIAAARLLFPHFPSAPHPLTLTIPAQRDHG
jgi:riboflavin kinase / FMN adenylyltransferase